MTGRCPSAPGRRRAVRRLRRVGTRRPFRLGVALLDARIAFRLAPIGAAVAAAGLAVALLAWRVAQELRIP